MVSVPKFRRFQESFVRSFAIVAAIPLALLFAACDSNGGEIEPVLVTDTFDIAAPTAAGSLPTAIDITALGGFSIVGGRYPEEVNDAGEWDLAVRLVGGELQ